MRGRGGIMSPNNDVLVLWVLLAISTVVLLLVALECHAAKILHIDDDGLCNCIPREREALLSFKSDLTDPSNVLSSWVEVDMEKDPRGADCCLWHGVVCHNSTGHVLQLRLPCVPPLDNYYCDEKTALGGKLNPSLLDLKRLTHLDLSGNSFDGIRIPHFLGFMANLRYLNLSSGGFRGAIPHQLGNLSGLQYLDLSGSNFSGTIPRQLGNLSSLQYLDLSGLYREYNDPAELKSGSLEWVSGLSSLRHLDLSWTNLSAANDWLQATNTLPSLQHLLLSGCSLNPETPPPPALNFSSLSALDLSVNSFPSIPEWIFRLPCLTSLSLYCCNWLEGSIPVGLITPIPDSISMGNLLSLKYLRLSSNVLHGPIPDSIGNLSYLNELDLRDNKLYGPIPDSIGNISSLNKLDLRFNELHGPIPDSIGNLFSLEEFSLDSNQLNGTLPASFGHLQNLVTFSTRDNLMKGVVTELHFAKLTKLTILDAGGNQLSFNVSPNWIPPFQLYFINLDFWNIGPLFPSWLQSQKSLISLRMSNAGISSSIPSWFWGSFPQCMSYNLSHNQIHGHLKSFPSVRHLDQMFVDFSSNHLSGALPPFPLGLLALDISNNSLTGSIFNFLCHKPEVLKSLVYLILRHNHFSQQIPDCWMSWTQLEMISLESNEFVGNIPSSIGQIKGLQSLHLRNNHLYGELPTSIGNCKKLMVVNLGENNLTGNISTWAWEKLSLLKILILHSNRFLGHIPMELCALTALQLLDLAHNNISGTIPRCFNNLTAMATAPNSSPSIEIHFNASIYSVIIEDAFIVTKDKNLEYTSNLGLMTLIDLSDNNLRGCIPIELTNFAGLRSLNLSKNFLVGQIPQNIGAMRLIESLDVSGNQILGQIPPSISNLTFLSVLKLSNNHLVGEIPRGSQLQTFPPSSFSGNELCGSPLPISCNNSSSSIKFISLHGKVKGGVEVDGVYVSMVTGFIVGFWIVWFPLILSKSWRLVYFRSINSLLQRFVFRC